MTKKCLISTDLKEYSFDYNCCSVSSLFNKITSFNKNENVKIVVGSLGFGLKDIHYEYGFENDRKYKDYKTKNGMDIHCWLEDSEGNIIDKYFDIYNLICKINNKKTLFNKEMVFKQKKETLKRMGIHYRPITDIKLQEKIFLSMNKPIIKDTGITKEQMKVLFKSLF